MDLRLQGGAGTTFCFGHAVDMVNQHAWTPAMRWQESFGRQPEAERLGLFDMHGTPGSGRQRLQEVDCIGRRPALPDADGSSDIPDNVPRVQMGGSWGNQAADVRADSEAGKSGLPMPPSASPGADHAVEKTGLVCISAIRPTRLRCATAAPAAGSTR